MIAIFPEIIALARTHDVERLAVFARRYFEDGAAGPRPDIRRMLAHAGLTVDTLPLDGAHGALVARDHKGAFRIGAISRPGLAVAEERFLLAHLFGHYLFDVLPLIASGDFAAGGYREANCPLKRYALTADGAVAPREDAELQMERKERRADAFAAALLMPRGMVKKAFERFKDAEQTAQFFAVTRPALLVRLAAIGVETDAENGQGPRNFLAAERQLKGAEAPSSAGASVEARLLASPANAMPRSFAASTYGSTERKTRNDAAPKVPLPTKTNVPAPKRPAANPAAPQAAEPPAAAASGATENPSALANAPAGANEAGGDGLTGMARLRAIARRLDKAVPK